MQDKLQPPLALLFTFPLSVINIALPDHNENDKVGEVGYSFSGSANGGKDPIPSDFPITYTIIDPINTEPNKNGFSNDMVFGNKSPKTTVFRTMTVISHHPVIVHFKCVLSTFFPVDQYVIAIGC